MEAKYIIIKISNLRREPEKEELLPIVFPKALMHKKVYESIRHSMLRDNNFIGNDIEIYSAGFIYQNEEVKAYGKSESLNIEYKENDEKHISSMLKGERVLIDLNQKDDNYKPQQLSLKAFANLSKLI